MQNNKIEQFLQDIHGLDDAKLDKKELKQKLEVLMSAKPDITADDAFKHKLRTRLNNIIEFKQSNAEVKKIGYLKILFPIFACFLFIIGIFSIIDIKLPWQSETYTPPIIAEPQNIIDPELSSHEIAEQIQQEEIKEKAISKKQQILEKSRLKKLSEQEWVEQTTLSDEALFGEQSFDTVEIQIAPLIEEESSDTPEESEIAIEIFSQSCEAFEWIVETSSWAMMCIKDEVTLCSRVDYENGKCSFLE